MLKAWAFHRWNGNAGGDGPVARSSDVNVTQQQEDVPLEAQVRAQREQRDEEFAVMLLAEELDANQQLLSEREALEAQVSRRRTCTFCYLIHQACSEHVLISELYTAAMMPLCHSKDMGA
jgi:hypothetical protein